MWIEHLQTIDRAAQTTIAELGAFQERLDQDASRQDEALLLLWSQTHGAGAVRPAIAEASQYITKQRDLMIKRFRDADMFHLMIAVYAVGDFEIYLQDVHGIGAAPAVADHRFIVAVQKLSAVKRDIAAQYSPDYDASDAAIEAELTQRNPWR